MNLIFSLGKKSLGALCLLGSLSTADIVLAQSFTFDGNDRVTTISNLQIGTATFDATFMPTDSFNDLFGSRFTPSPIPTFFSPGGSGLAFATATQAAEAIRDALNSAGASPGGAINSGETTGAAGDGFSIPELVAGAAGFRRDLNVAVGSDNIALDFDTDAEPFSGSPIVTFTPAAVVPEGSTIWGTLLGLLMGGGLMVRHHRRRAACK